MFGGGGDVYTWNCELLVNLVHWHNGLQKGCEFVIAVVRAIRERILKNADGEGEDGTSGLYKGLNSYTDYSQVL